MIAVEGVALAYHGSRVLHDITLTVRAGELLALVGPNGAGKSTLLRALAGAFAVEAGSITVDGRILSTLSAAERGRVAALVEAEGPVPEGMTAGEVIAMGRLPFQPWWRWSTSEADREAVDGAIARFGLQSMVERPFAELSSGERQRVWIALALAQNARTLLLDEPTSHLDVRHAFEALTLVRSLVAEGHGAVVVLHDLNLAASFADRVALLGGRTLLACGTPSEVYDEARLERAYGIPIAVRREPDGRVVTFAAAPAR
ncbi:MAG: Fe(3+) dicitrate ABC transporter ATP-binding protein FecE [Candidatus Velthaea sp.]